MANAVVPYVDGQVWDKTDANWVAGFGDGSDGAFNETSGTTNLTQGVVHQYTSFILDTSATLSASSTSDKPIIILVQGNVTINGTVDLTGKGSTTSYHSVLGTIGNTGNAGSPGTKGIKGIPSWNLQNNQYGFIMNGTKGGNGSNNSGGSAGGGGGGGASSSTDGTAGSSGGSPGTGGSVGSGNNGGCTIYILCAGTLTLGASSSIDVSGLDGNAASSGDSGGGGGGGAGDVIIIHFGAKTDNGLTTDVTGGSGGAGSSNGGNGGVGAAGQVKIEAYSTILW